MRTFSLLGLVVLLASCTPESVVLPLKPKLILPRVVDTQQKTILLRGKDLGGAERITINGQLVTIREIKPDSVLVELNASLPEGEYSLSFSNAAGQTFESNRGLLVLPKELDTGSTRYLETKTALLTYSPKVAAVMETAWKKAQFDMEATWDPFLPGNPGICGRVITALRDTRVLAERSTLDGINTLVDQLSENSSEDFEVNLRYVDRGPDSYLSQEPIGVVPGVIPVSSFDFLSPLPIAPKLSVAVLDTGLSQKDEILRNGSTIDTVSGRNFTFPSGDPSNILDDAVERKYDGSLISKQNIGHGTAVATELSRTAVTNIVPVKVCDADGKCKSPSLIAGVCYVASLAKREVRPVRVMNLSLNGGYHNLLFYQALQEAASQGISIVASSGNQREVGVGRPNPDSFPAYYSIDHPKGQHKAIPGFLSVGSVRLNTASTNFSIGPSDFSSEGPWVTVSALGEDRTLPRADGNGKYLFTGTSFSAPQVAGKIAKILSMDPKLDPVLAKTKFLQSETVPLPNCPVNRCGLGYLSMDLGGQSIAPSFP